MASKFDRLRSCGGEEAEFCENLLPRRLRILRRRPSPGLTAQLVIFILASTIWPGCASHNVDPPVARAQTGYIDIFDPEGRALSWEIRDVRGQRSLYTEYKAKSEIVRLALPPGSYALKITVLNAAISNPATSEVQVVDGKVTPVRVRLLENGTTQVESKHTQVPGRYTRRTKITVDETQNFRLEAEALPSIAYSPKEQVPYALKAQP
jgi:hypothetical protein